MILAVLAGAFTMEACQNKRETVNASTAPAYHK